MITASGADETEHVPSAEGPVYQRCPQRSRILKNVVGSFGLDSSLHTEAVN